MASSVPQAAVAADIETFLQQHEEKDLLRFSTAGSVDDGKSTLIGRLLYDSKGIYEDQLVSVRKVSKQDTFGGLDFALLTDGLRAEREQGITIDVAYRYFSTPRRKFIIADTPGHEQYTRNMATGASTANLAIILVDACNGVRQQSRRHAFIASLLGIQHIVVAVNKMDLVDYREEVFEKIRCEFTDFASQLQIPDLHFIPISALRGDNVVDKSQAMPWFEGSSLLRYLETVHIGSDRNLTEMRFPVQCVLRPNLNFRGYAGQIASGVIKPGDPVMVLPSGRVSRVKSITTYDGDLAQAFPPMSVTVCLEDEIDISRGDMLVPPLHPPHVSCRIDARIVWMHERPLELGRTYLVKHTTQMVQATVQTLRYRFNINTLEKQPAGSLGLNDIGAVVFETRRALFYDPYRRNRATGSFVLIDPLSNATVAAGLITAREVRERVPPSGQNGNGQGLSIDGRRITRFEQQTRAGHRAATVWLEGAAETGYILERKLFDRDCRVHALVADEENGHTAAVARILNDAGLIVILVAGKRASREQTRTAVGPDQFVPVEGTESAGNPEQAAEAIVRLLEEQGFIPGPSSGD